MSDKTVTEGCVHCTEELIMSRVPCQDSQSHRIIEKRRRDRINSSLADLGTLITNDCVRQGHGQGQSLMTQYAGQGRIKKTEIIEMAIQHIRHLQSELLGLHAFSVVRPRRSRSAAAYSHQTFPCTICRSVCLSSALWKNGRSQPADVRHHTSDGSTDEAGIGVWQSVHGKGYFWGRIWTAPL